MKLVQNYLTNSDCYKAGKKITVKGLMIHSIGCPQPKASAIMNNWNKSGTNACVHAIIDGNDGTVYQTLPWNHRGWHAGGSANTPSFEYLLIKIKADCISSYSSTSPS